MRCAFFGMIALLLAGCQSAPHPAAGMAGVSIKVMAEPKAGIQSPRGRVMSYDTPDQRGYGDFERVDYSNLGQIVVWLEPQDSARAVAPAAGQITLDIDARHPATEVSHVASVGQTVVVRNVGSRPEVIDSVSDGNDFDAGTVAPSGNAHFTVRSSGLIEVLTETSADPVARIYAAPTRWVKLARAGQIVQFTDVPPGNYRVVAWHPRLPGSQTSLTLAPNEVANVTIAVGVNSLPKVESQNQKPSPSALRPPGPDRTGG